MKEEIEEFFESQISQVKIKLYFINFNTFELAQFIMGCERPKGEGENLDFKW